MNRGLLAPVLAMAFGLAGCEPADLGVQLTPDNGTRTVIIGVSAEGAGTKVSISEELVFSWTAGDKIAVWAGSEGSGQYYTSEAYTGGNTYQISLSGTRSNYAVYPASIAVAEAATATSLKVTLPAEYDIEGNGATFSPLPMLAENTEGADLEFKHLGGLLRLTVNSVPTGTTKLVVDLGQRISGSFDVVSDESSGDLVIQAGEGSTPVTFHVTSSGDGLVLNLPVPTGTYTTLVVEAQNNTGDVLATMDSPFSWTCARAHGKKVEDATVNWDYIVETIGDIQFTNLISLTSNVQVKSYRQNSDDATVKQPVAWKAQALSTEDGTTWVDYGEAGWPAWLTLSAYEGEGSTASAGETIMVTVTPDSETYSVTEVAATGHISALRGSAAVGTADAPRDLSLYDIYGNTYVNGPNAVGSIKKAGPHTANCYVVSAPGWYCIPLVYGNGIDATRGTTFQRDPIYTDAYSKYQNADGNLISSPFILTDTGVDAAVCDAVVLWQDQPSGFGLIHDAVEVIDAPSGAGLQCKYLKFHIAPEDILPGNAVIALRDTQNGNKILWSWHIWVTPVSHTSESDAFAIRNLTWRKTESTSTDPADLGTVDILNCNLGWTEPLSFTLSTGGSTSLRIVQTSTPDFDDETFGVSYQSSASYTGTYFGCTYYQWGRKDPFLPSNGNSDNAATNRASHSPSGYRIFGTDPTLAVYSGSLAYTPSRWIQQPNRFDNSFSPSSWVSNKSLGDLWNYNMDGTEAAGDFQQSKLARTHELASRMVGKTIQDPSPAGFCVPFGRAFCGFTTDGNIDQHGSGICGQNVGTGVVASGYPAGYRFSYNASQVSSTYTVYVAASGGRHFNTSALGSGATNICGYYWMAVPGDDTGSAANSSMVISYVTTPNPHVFPIYIGTQSSGYAVRPMLEQDLSSFTVNGEGLAGWK